MQAPNPTAEHVQLTPCTTTTTPTHLKMLWCPFSGQRRSDTKRSVPSHAAVSLRGGRGGWGFGGASRVRRAALQDVHCPAPYLPAHAHACHTPPPPTHLMSYTCPSKQQYMRMMRPRRKPVPQGRGVSVTCGDVEPCAGPGPYCAWTHVRPWPGFPPCMLPPHLRSPPQTIFHLCARRGACRTRHTAAPCVGAGRGSAASSGLTRTRRSAAGCRLRRAAGGARGGVRSQRWPRPCCAAHMCGAAWQSGQGDQPASRAALRI